MDKRVIVSFLSVVVLSALLIFRIAYIAETENSAADSGQSAKVIELAQSRGMIYDRNMLPLVSVNKKRILAVNPTPEAVIELQKYLSESEYGKITEQLAQGKPVVAECGSYDGECDDIVPLDIYDRYSSDDCCAHVVGYLNGEGKGVSGIEKSFNELLMKYSGSLSVRFSVDVNGNALSGKGIEVSDKGYNSGGGIVLTVDRSIQKICEDVIKTDSLGNGAVVVLNAENSEILAMASSPVYDRKNLAKGLKDENSPFLNRAVSEYTVGSVFKSVVAAAALEKGISASREFECTGAVTVNGQTFSCHDKSGHGKVDMQQAMAVSCNCYFIQLGLETGAENIIKLAALLGMGTENQLSDGITDSGGILPSPEDIDSKAALANLSFGQGELLATPLQIAALYCAFANGGYYRKPYILKETVDENGETVAYYKNDDGAKIISGGVCNLVCNMLKKTVEEGSGKLAQPICGGAAGKTATAQTGWYENGTEVVHTWFAGYFPADKPKYVITVFREKGSSSSTDCAPLFRDISDRIISYETN